MRHVFITGASTGLGRELAKELALRGYNLSLFARRGELLEELKAELQKMGRKVFTFAGSVTDYAAVKNAVRKAEMEIGPIDIMVANAGIGYPIYSDRFKEDMAREILEVNVLGVMHAVGAVAPLFKERRRGQIVGISSLASYVSIPGHTVYSASKAAVSSYLDGLRVEMAPYKVQVATISPGFIKTPMTENNRFKMPFLMEADAAAKIVANKMEKGSEWVHFPRPLFAGIQALRMLPRPVVKALLGRGARAVL